MAPFVLKFKGNKSFSPFSNLADGDALAKTWKVCTKVAAHLEQGQRLENLSWRLWHLQNLMVDNDNAKSRREFKKLSKHMGERLDKDKGRSIEELEAPDFKPDGTSLGKIKRRAEEKEQRGGRTGMKAMTFTFPVDPATNSTPGATAPILAKKPLPNPQKLSLYGADLMLPEERLAAGGLTIDTQLGSANGGENAATPTGSSVPVNRTHYRGHHDSISSVNSDIYNAPQFAAPSPPISNSSSGNGQSGIALAQGQPQQPGVIRFPNIFDDGFGPTALLCPAPSVKQNCTYGEAIGFAGLSSSANHADVFSIPRPTFEFPLDELMNGDGSDAGSTTGYDSTSNLTNSVSSLSIPTPVSASMASFRELQITNIFGNGTTTAVPDAMQGVQATGMAMSKDTNNSHGHGQIHLHHHQQPIIVDADLDGDELIRKSPPLIPSQSAPASPAVFPTPTSGNNNSNNNNTTYPFPAASSPTDSFQIPPPLTLPKGANLPGPSPTPTPAPSSSPGAPHRLPRRYSTTNAPPHTSSGSGDGLSAGGNGKKGRHGPSATATAPRTIRSSYGNSAPGGVKSECANCGANSTPLWRRGLNDELNCNACGLFAKLHKRPRPKSLRNSGGEGGSRNPGWASSRNGDETVSCYNCATTATPLWRKDEDGRTLCNACGLYLKLHGEKRPSSMKSDVIRKRSRTDARRGTSSSATPSASPGASRRTSPTPPMVTQPADNGNFVPNHGNPQQQGVDHHSPYGPASAAAYEAFGNANGSQGQDNSPVDLMSMSHSMVSDAGVDPSASALGGMTFSPGLTYTETLHYPGPLSLSYYQAQYGMPPELTVPAEPPNQNGANGPVQVAGNAGNGQQQGPQDNNGLQGVGSPGVFGAGAGLAGAADGGASVWDTQFQLPFTSNYSFGFGPGVNNGAGPGNDGSNGAGNGFGGDNGGLGVLHPPMLPSWYSSTTGAEGGPTKTEPEHDIAFGHH